MPVIRLPDIAFGAEAWALVELEIPAGLAVDECRALLQAAVTAVDAGRRPDGLHRCDADAAGVCRYRSGRHCCPIRWSSPAAPNWMPASCSNRPGRPPNTATGAAIERLLAEARQRFADQPWVIEVLANMAETRPVDGCGALPEGGALLIPQDGVAAFGEGRIPGDVARRGVRQGQLPAAQDGAGQGAVRQAGRFAEIGVLVCSSGKVCLRLTIVQLSCTTQPPGCISEILMGVACTVDWYPCISLYA